MKKLNLLLLMMLSLVIMTTSCEKESVTPDKEKESESITVNDLLGDWKFVSLNYKNHVYETETELKALSESLRLVKLDFNFTENKMTFHTFYANNGQGGSATYDYTLDKLIINGGDEYVTQIKFEIVNDDTFNGTELKLKLIKSIFKNEVVPFNGIYTLKKIK